MPSPTSTHRCTATKQNGTNCKNRPMKGQQVCHAHLRRQQTPNEPKAKIKGKFVATKCLKPGLRKAQGQKPKPEQLPGNHISPNKLRSNSPSPKTTQIQTDKGKSASSHAIQQQTIGTPNIKGKRRTLPKATPSPPHLADISAPNPTSNPPSPKEASDSDLDRRERRILEWQKRNLAAAIILSW
ncbi:hypothetical protein MMC30_003909 [Trapelia coarctata]|nr:hypothetical protein [Trapelia coarctata]